MRPKVYPPRPTVAFRVGITGSRDINPVRSAELMRQVRQVLSVVAAELGSMVIDPTTAKVYSLPQGISAKLYLRFLSPLARGADRIGANAALLEGYQLYVPMPFPRKQYEQDFTTPEDLTQFEFLLNKASENWLEMDGDREAGCGSAYEAVGRLVVRNCDLLIAVWDGEVDGNGRGGTADTIRYAASTGVPVWWLHAKVDTPPVWLADIQDLRDPRADAPNPFTALRATLESIIRPPLQSPWHDHGVTQWLAHVGRSRDVSPIAQYLAGEHRLTPHLVWRLYDGFMWLFAGISAPVTDPTQRQLPHDAVAAFWLARFLPADALAMLYADRYRSGYLWTFMFALLSVISGACSLVPPEGWSRSVWAVASTSAELSMLTFVLMLVWWGIRNEWHEHSIELRLLAELCRKQQMLGPLGWTLPITDIRAMSEAEDTIPERSAWVAWLFAAEQRAAPLPIGTLAETTDGPLRQAILDDLISEQYDYHRCRAVGDGRAAQRLAATSEVSFFLVLLLLAGKLAASVFAMQVRNSWQIGLAAAILPAVSAAFVGIRAYAELPLLTVQSRHMLLALQGARARVERLGAGRPLLSQDMGAEAAVVATLMLQDLDGWARLFRVKTLEPGA